MTTKYGLFAEPPYLSPGAGAPKEDSSSRKAEEGVKSGFRAGSGNKSGKVLSLLFASGRHRTDQIV